MGARVVEKDLGRYVDAVRVVHSIAGRHVSIHHAKIRHDTLERIWWHPRGLLTGLLLRSSSRAGTPLRGCWASWPKLAPTSKNDDYRAGLNQFAPTNGTA